MSQASLKSENKLVQPLPAEGDLMRSIKTMYDPGGPLLELYPIDIPVSVQNDIHAKLFTAALFVFLKRINNQESSG